ncbi:TOTE conflict system archaeo-eukaryotic primase domain-containing protein [Paenibacillus piri]|uniref:DEAD/DEAH box helicase n=1 Tax=Paenibacillus piri TaxID=2547395 RepID=A0A4R5KQM8_9BACL|nr:DEAD/DEAH box helicase [Paenibacillus piri]TDF97057.1 DEAD/DEAH box helicase [Paenibacillus piri]
MNDFKNMLKNALLEIQRLRQENEHLKRELSKYTSSSSAEAADSSQSKVNGSRELQEFKIEDVHHFSSPSEKIALFRSLFKGREDVFPMRWENKAGRSGYSPACGNEWTIVCKKPQVKCSECPHKDFLPVADAVINKHLDAKTNQTIGVYAMLPDETCWFLAVDFDKRNWKEDALSVMTVCKELNVPAALERSRSGQGGHIWIFFDEAIDANLARKLGCAILTKTMDKRNQIGLDSYDRLFPNQDTLPKGGFGNLIALPLQGIPRKSGNSVFVDETFQPYPDQWLFLSQLKKMSREHVQGIVQDAVSNSSVLNVGYRDPDTDAEKPWEQANEILEERHIEEPLPSKVKIVLSNMIYIEKNDLPPVMINRIFRLAAFQNPDFYKTQAMRLSTFGKPRVISCAEDFPKHIALPRGCLQGLLDFLKIHSIEPVIADERFQGIHIDVDFNGTLTMLQDTAARSILAHETGILSATTAFGKTVVAASIIAKRKINTLILVNRRELMDQWKERLSTFLNVDKKSIGVIGGGKEKRTGQIDIAVIQSLNQKGIIKEYINEYGQIVVDECHHVSAFSFEQILKKATAKHVFGLTATPTRQDGHQPIVLMQCGPIRIRVDAKSQALTRNMQLKVIPRYTPFRMPNQLSNPGIQDVYRALINDEERNEMIFDDLLRCLEQGRSPILLAERTAHVEYFEKRLQNFAKNVIVLRGGMGKKQRASLREKIAAIGDKEERVLIATGKLIGEGFDDARLDTLFLVHPISWKGTLQQYAGRLHRSHINKIDVQVYDYIDLQVPVLMSMFRKRVKGYKLMGYTGVDLM